jgi:superfamily II DNA or RNA helicase
MQPLRHYQQRAVRHLESRKGSRLLLVSPTGSGKTRILIDVARRHSGRVLVLCPWRQLVFQTCDYMNELGVPAEVHLGARKSKGNQVVVTTVQTAARRKLGQFGLVFIDEAHRAVAPQCRSVLRRYPNARLVGATATAMRLDRKPLGDVFNELYEVVDTQTLINEGFLVAPTVYGPRQPIDLSKVRYDRRTGDYSTRSAGRHMSRPKLIGNAVKHWHNLARNRPTFVYCCHLAHARQVLEQFERAGARAGILDGSTAQTKREGLLEQLGAGDLQLLINVGVLTESVDFPPLQCQVLLRPTLSMGLHLQIVGRGLRPSEGKHDCLYLDHADNFRRHGFPQDRRKWTLTPKPRRPSRKAIEGGPPKARPCPRCKRMIPFSTKICPHCGYASLPTVLPGRLIRQHHRRPRLIPL